MKLVLPILCVVLLAGCEGNNTSNTTGPEPTMPAGHMHTPGMTHDSGTATAPVGTQAGQAAFAAIQETVQLLEANPNTDWSTVNLTALRDHLVDMDEVTLHAMVVEQQVPGGLRMTVTGTGRTLEAIQRMVPEHAATGLTSIPAWNATVQIIPEGIVLTVSAAAPNEIAHIRGLGFFGIMATGSHHAQHHLMLALGQAMHQT